MTARVRALAVAVALVLAGGVVAAATGEPARRVGTKSLPSATSSPVPVSPDVSPLVASSAPAATAAPTDPATPSAPPSTVAPSGRAVIVPWHACEGGGLQCATVVVPLDRARAGGPTVPLALIRIPASDRRARIGSLLVNPGGPGASGYEWVRDSAPSVLSATLRSHFDVVGFDPRGVGRSRAVDCEPDADLSRLFHTDPEPLDDARRQSYARQSAALSAGCQQRSGDLLAHVGTVEAATDLDAIRQALGERTISYFGYSYGTYLGATWLDLFPGTVRAAVLDGPLDPALSLDGFVADQGVAFDEALQRWFSWCDADPSCDFRVAGSPSAARFDDLAARIHRTPLKAAPGRTLAYGELQYGVGYGLYSRYLWSELGSALTLAADGDGSGLLDMSDSYLSRSHDGHYDSSFEANLAVNCLDHQGPRTEQGWYDAADRTRAKAPRLGFAIVWTTLPCATWPVPARRARIPTGRGAPPALIVAGLHDPATPYAWGEALAHDLVGSRLVTRRRDAGGDGHTSYGGISPCTVHLVDAYLVAGTLPPAGATC